MSVWEIHETQSGSVWAGTDTGLGRLDPLSNDKQRWVAYTDENAPVTREMRSIKETSTGELWMRESREAGEAKSYITFPTRTRRKHTSPPPRNAFHPRVPYTSNGQARTFGIRHPQTPSAISGGWTMEPGLRHPEYQPPPSRTWPRAHIVSRFAQSTLTAMWMTLRPSHAFIVEAPWWRNPVVAGPGFLVIVFALFQSARVVQAKRKLQESVQALSSANNELFQVNRDLETANFELQRDRRSNASVLKSSRWIAQRTSRGCCRC